MKIIDNLEQAALLKESYFFALGNFDGLHLGHMQLLKKMLECCRKTGTKAAVFLFHPHPQEFLDPKKSPQFLLDFERKLEMFEASGVEVVFVMPFTQFFADLTPEQFVYEILKERLRVFGVCVGFNYRFGKAAAGTPEDLLKYGRECGFQVEIVPPVIIDNILVSSTIIRKALAKGDIEQAKKLLGYRPLIRGTVVSGDGRGTNLGFPTANLKVSSKLLVPLDGVYMGCARFEGRNNIPVVVNIGTCPTFKIAGKRTIEAYLLAYSGSIYGKIIEIEFLGRLREERKFASSQELIEQIKKDVAKTLNVFNLHNIQTVIRCK